MRRFLFLLCILGFVIFGAQMAAAQSIVDIYVDAAPNVYGSPDYAPWQTATFSAVADGTFVNMSNGVNSANIGTTDFEIQDEVVYSFGDFGLRLTWIYWIPDQIVSSLTDNFKISLENWWDGEYLDFYDDYYGSTWLEPTKWIDYDVNGDGDFDGVIGTAGMAWWGAYGINTQEALDADIAAWQTAAETWKFTAQLYGEEYSLLSNRAPVVPEPSTMILLGFGLIGLAGVTRKKLNK